MQKWGQLHCPALCRMLSLTECQAYQTQASTNGFDVAVEKMLQVCRRCLYFKGETS
ncbi:MAG: hypothetical protein HQM01_13095 [Magnetococcales bacterium]|nr:hypothetical protein [Magnetococcales bacterium]